MSVPKIDDAELRKLCEAATPAPWFRCDFREASKNPSLRDISISCDWPAYIGIASMENGMTAEPEEALANAAFIAAARTAIPDLLNDKARLMEEVERLRDALIKTGIAAGALLAEEVSTDFLMNVPEEIGLVLQRKNARIAELNAMFEHTEIARALAIGGERFALQQRDEARDERGAALGAQAERSSELKAGDISVQIASYDMGLRDGAKDPGKAFRYLRTCGPLMDEPGFEEAQRGAIERMNAAAEAIRARDAAQSKSEPHNG